MDRNQATGLILIALMVILYFQFFAPEPPKVEPGATDSTQVVENTDPSINPQQIDSAEESVIPDSLISQAMIQKFGAFAAGAEGNAEIINLETDALSLEFNTKGGQIQKATLKKFKNSEAEPLVLFDQDSKKAKLILNTLNRKVNLNELYYSSSTSTKNDSTVVTFLLELENNRTIRHQYIIPKNGYEILYDLDITGFDGQLAPEMSLEWDYQMITQEKDTELSRTNSTINYLLSDGEFDYLAERSTELEEENLGSTKWIALKQRFFISGLVAADNFSSAYISTSVPNTPEVVKNAKMTASIPTENLKKDNLLTYYFGPNDYQITKHVTEDFERNLSLGWPPMKWVNQLVIIPLFNFLNRFISNYGLIIIIMVFIIKLALSPLSYKSYLSMAKMKVLKPDLDEIKEKHGDDMGKAQQEQMKLYQQVGVNPISGCVPMLLQMPILLAMFYFFPQSIELRQESFLWADDLSTYDSILSLPFEIPFYGDHVSLFVLLMTASTIAMTYSQQQVSTVQGPMKAFSYMMPLIFMFVLNSYPAALSFYYFISNLVTFGQQMLIRRFVDEEKIKLILAENRKKNANKKKSKFQMRLEEAMKASKDKTKGKRK